ncbi:hypothetical protein QUF72_03120 [Desulfobacterales bacterium HSG2]|nr:hypothetical protein [Desulfobacterales bacterium HSG2]
MCLPDNMLYYSNEKPGPIRKSGFKLSGISGFRVRIAGQIRPVVKIPSAFKYPVINFSGISGFRVRTEKVSSARNDISLLMENPEKLLARCLSVQVAYRKSRKTFGQMLIGTEYHPLLLNIRIV